MEAGYMPGDVWIDRSDKLRYILQFLVGIIPAGDQQGGDFYPDPEFLHQTYTIEDRFQVGPADLTVKLVCKGFEVDVVTVEERGDLPGRFRADIAVADKSIHDPLLVGQSGRIQGELEENGWFNVGVADTGTVL